MAWLTSFWSEMHKVGPLIEQAPMSFVTIFALLALAAYGFHRWRTGALRERIAEAQADAARWKEQLNELAPSQVRMQIRITSPAPNAQVARMVSVQGTVAPRGSRVQLLVLSGDRQWHVQPPAAYGTGLDWSATCFAGAEDAPPGSRFDIVAVDGRAHLDGILKDLPTEIARSNIVSVRR